MCCMTSIVATLTFPAAVACLIIAVHYERASQMPSVYFPMQISEDSDQPPYGNIMRWRPYFGYREEGSGEGSGESAARTFGDVLISADIVWKGEIAWTAGGAVDAVLFVLLLIVWPCVMVFNCYTANRNDSNDDYDVAQRAEDIRLAHQEEADNRQSCGQTDYYFLRKRWRAEEFARIGPAKISTLSGETYTVQWPPTMPIDVGFDLKGLLQKQHKEHFGNADFHLIDNATGLSLDVIEHHQKAFGVNATVLFEAAASTTASAGQRRVFQQTTV